MSDENREALEQSAQRVSEIESLGEGGKKTVALSTGVILRVKEVPPLLIQDISVFAAKKRPKPPVVHLESVDRSEENPNDPDYKEALDAWQTQVYTDINNAFILLGTEVEFVPDGMIGPEDHELDDVLEVFGFAPKSKRERYLAWVKYVAMADKQDVADVVAAVGRRVGVTEEDVKNAVDGFRR